MHNDDTPQQRRITAQDLTKITYVEDPQVSPDGQWVAFVQAVPDLAEKSYKRNIYLLGPDGKTHQITRSNKDMSPRWSPDGTTLAFASARNERPQIYLLPIGTPGEPRQLTSHENGATSFNWSPDGAQIAYLVPMNAAERAEEGSNDQPEAPQDKIEGKYRKERKAEDEKNRYDPRPMQLIPYRSGTRFLDDRFTQVYVMPTADDLASEQAKPRRLTDMDAAYGEPRWSPDGKTLYTYRTTRPDWDQRWRYANIYTLDVASSSETRLVDDEHMVVNPKPSPDGRWIACIWLDRVRTDDLPALMLLPTDPDAGDPISLTQHIDRAAYDYFWTHDSQLVAQFAKDGNGELHRIDPDTQAFTPLVQADMIVESASYSDDGRVMAFAASTPMNPNELYSLRDGQMVQLTDVNKAFLDSVQVQETHEIVFKSPGGKDVQGWYILPPDYDPDTDAKYPLALNIHGGPHVMWGSAMKSMWHEWQFHAARGYVVFYCNPRGSNGYGQDFQRDLRGDWGGVAMDDVMAGVDALIDKGFVDTERMAITGGSYGGYMTAWIISHTQRFKAAVGQRGVYNLLSFYGTSDVPMLIEGEYGVSPWDDPHLLWQHSPIAHAKNIKTPLLILHAENDYRVPIEQGEQLFAYIRRLGGTVKMLRYPREGHEMSRNGEPAHRISRLTEMVNWFDRYCMPQTLTADAQPDAAD
jgi:dipeptidyl aminopeptidase/acylaminoacyl peptidase